MMDKFSVRKQSEGVPLQDPTLSFSRMIIETSSKKTIRKQNTHCFRSEWETQYVVVRNDANTCVICRICCAALFGFHKANCERHHSGTTKGENTTCLWNS
jgi:hypothetical protein